MLHFGVRTFLYSSLSSDKAVCFSAKVIKMLISTHNCAVVPFLIKSVWLNLFLSLSSNAMSDQSTRFVVSALKYRPQVFEDVVGQSAITSTLKNAIDQNHLAQALLFCGPRGVGKTTCARILAKMINRKNDPSEFNENEDFAFNIFELDAASNNSVDDIRNLTDQIRIPPQVGEYKVYIIDEVHMLSQAAFNAFLKTLEEPPKHCIFILATTEKHKIIPTILSRCQIFDFKRITVGDVKNYLKKVADDQGINASDDALHIIAQKADGAMRDALSVFDRVVSFSGKELTLQAVTENLNVLDYDVYFKTTDAIINHDIPSLLMAFDAVLDQGFDGQHFIRGLASHFRDLLICQSTATQTLLEAGEQTKQKYLSQSKAVDQDLLLQGIDLANSCDLKYKSSQSQRLLVELCLMQLASITFSDEKKNSTPEIIPASAVRASSNSTEPPIYIEETKIDAVADPTTDEKEEQVPQLPEIILKNPIRPPSGLSIKSIEKKKAHELKRIEVNEVQTESLPAMAFSEEDLFEYWNKYRLKLEESGQHNLASIMGISEPKLENCTIHLSLPNTTNKRELMREQGSLLKYLHQALQNYTIELAIEINEETVKSFVYTDAEKFEKLKEKNPALEQLRQTFQLDL